MPVLHIFPDTNILLHYRPLAEIDWSAICCTTDLQIVICMQVIDELDDKKCDVRLADRARRAIKDIERFLQARTVGKGIAFDCCRVDLGGTGNADNLIVRAVQQYLDDHPGVAVAIATEDLGMKLRCMGEGLRVVQVPQSFRLENPADENAKKLTEAQREIQKLRNRIPRLRLSVNLMDSCTGDSEFEIKDVRKYRNKEEILARLPSKIHPSLRNLKLNKSLQTYAEQYSVYLDRLEIHERIVSHAFRFKLAIENEGTAPASNVAVKVRFPESIARVFSEDSDLAKVLDPDFAEPEPPTIEFVGNAMAAFDSRSDLSIPRVTFVEPRQYKSKCFSEDGKWQITAEVVTVQHGRPTEIGTYFAVFHPDSVAPIKLPYTVYADELPEPHNNALDVSVRRA